MRNYSNGRSYVTSLISGESVSRYLLPRLLLPFTPSPLHNLVVVVVVVVVLLLLLLLLQGSDSRLLRG
jgi:hypothetical protein